MTWLCPRCHSAKSAGTTRRRDGSIVRVECHGRADGDYIGSSVRPDPRPFVKACGWASEDAGEIERWERETKGATT